MSDKVSIIVPVYNVESYLERCVTSLLKQTHSNIEILLIDDGSPDGSAAICDAFAEQDSRVTALHQQNQGVSAVRNRGLAAATGDWICFCDGDDWYEPELAEKMLRCAKEEQADYIICRYRIAAERPMPLSSRSLGQLRSGCSNRLVVALGPTSSCTHMIRRELFRISGVCYPVGCRQSEELPVIPVLAKYARRIGVVDEALYNYFQRGDGTSASNAPVWSETDFRQSYALMCQNLGGDYRKEAECHAIYALLYGGILGLCKQRASANAIRQRIRTFRAEFPDYRKNPYLKKMGAAKRLFLTFAHLRWVTGLRLLSWAHRKIVN